MPKVVDHEERRSHLAEIVTRIIIRDGFDQVTMRKVAAEAGYAHGAIARYFPNKRSLLTSAFLHVFHESHQRTLEVISHTRGLKGIRLFCRELLPFDGSEPSGARIVLAFWDRAAQDRSLWDIHHANITMRRGLIRRLVDEAREDGEIPPETDTENAVNFISAHNAGWQMMAVLVPEVAIEQEFNASIDSLIRALATRTS